MSIYDFNILTDHHKYDLTFTQAQFVDAVTDAETKYVLYALSDFWVEVEYNPQQTKLKAYVALFRVIN